MGGHHVMVEMRESYDIMRIFVTQVGPSGTIAAFCKLLCTYTQHFDFAEVAPEHVQFTREAASRHAGESSH